MKLNQEGFTLIELMMVVAIIGLLAAVALPSYQDYIIRTKMAEVILLASNCRTPISEVYVSGGDPPGANYWGCETTSGGASKYVDTVTTDDHGVVTVKIATGIETNRVDGKIITLAPLIDGTLAQTPDDMGKSINGWRCGSPADGTTLVMNLLPGSCRGL
jgi:type IV pilus assembly protein PilA